MILKLNIVLLHEKDLKHSIRCKTLYNIKPVFITFLEITWYVKTCVCHFFISSKESPWRIIENGFYFT